MFSFKIIYYVRSRFQDMKHWIFLKLMVIISIQTSLISMEETERVYNVIQHHPTAFVSKFEAKSTTAALCECYNATELTSPEIECRLFFLIKNNTCIFSIVRVMLSFRCSGNEIPSDLPKNLQRITISGSDIKNLSRNSLQPYRETLMDVWVVRIIFFLFASCQMADCLSIRNDIYKFIHQRPFQARGFS